jgi:hypothetical protein
MKLPVQIPYPDKSLNMATPLMDDEFISKLESAQFAELLFRRALAAGEDLYDSRAYARVELEPNQYKANLLFYLRRRAWGEWYFGTVTPSRQIALLPDSMADLKLRLARQIVDEVRHHDVFVRALERKGTRSRLADFNPPKALLQMRSEQLGCECVVELAAANQYSGEVVLLSHSRPEHNILTELLDEETMAAILEIGLDEPKHVSIGRDLVKRLAVNLPIRKRILVAQTRFLNAQITQHMAEIEMLGSRRIRPLPPLGPLVLDPPGPKLDHYPVAET